VPDAGQIIAFFLVLLRATAFLVAGPLYALSGIPVLLKVGFSLVLALVIFPVIAGGLPPLPGDVWGYGLAAVSETGAGLLLGLAVTMVLNIARMAGRFIDFQIGYAMSSTLDPLSGGQGTLLSRYLYMLALVFFLIVDGHHVMLTGFAGSFALVPLGTAVFTGGAALTLLKIFCGAFTLALQISAPILAVMVMVDLALGFLARTTPQINVFLTGFPVKIMVGLLTLSFLMPLLGVVLRSLIDMVERDLYLLMRVLV
jgi:flagellar biosynthetic protein FliR